MTDSGTSISWRYLIGNVLLAIGLTDSGVWVRDRESARRSAPRYGSHVIELDRYRHAIGCITCTAGGACAFTSRQVGLDTDNRYARLCQLGLQVCPGGFIPAVQGTAGWSRKPVSFPRVSNGTLAHDDPSIPEREGDATRFVGPLQDPPARDIDTSVHPFVVRSSRLKPASAA
ncbi:hypothetical protein VTK73DRAFT_3731 [Phialemonium thermophilum]|uniref:Uncharacterized protein n=1 Tax=Phialemonium thermophilum TaxID=223376 RepID=A0ABR3VFH8_9PEZI